MESHDQPTGGNQGGEESQVWPPQEQTASTPEQPANETPPQTHHDIPTQQPQTDQHTPQASQPQGVAQGTQDVASVQPQGVQGVAQGGQPQGVQGLVQGGQPQGEPHLHGRPGVQSSHPQGGPNVHGRPEMRHPQNPYGPAQGARPYGPVPYGGSFGGGQPPFGPQPAPQPGWWNSRRKAAAAGTALALVLAGGVAGGAAGALIAGNHTTYASPTAVQPASNKDATGIAAIAQAVQPSVVSITVTTEEGQEGGSGEILRSDGTILTNNHVVASAAQGGQIAVKFSDGKKTTATVVGTDPTTDLAVIKAQGVSGLKPVTLGNSDQLKVGDQVVAIGSPLGLDGSVTSGIVSALHRTLNEGNDQQQPGSGQRQQQSGATIGDAIQTDAAINPGNSGGALVNSSGQVIGINTAIATGGSGSEGNIGIGFAIPINTAKQVSDQLIKGGKATHAFLGVTLSDATGNQQGALIASVQSGTPAAKAGLKEGDIVTQVDGKAVDGADTLSAAIRGHQPGDSVPLTYVRNGQKHTVTVSLSSS